MFPARCAARAVPSLCPSPDKGLPLSLEGRRTPRIPFVATAEIIDEAENTRTTSQLSDLSLHGCFVQLPNPFPEGTPVTIEIYKDEDFVETSATVAFLMPKRGMGLSFAGMERNLLPYSRNGFRDRKLPPARLKKRHTRQSTNRAVVILTCT